MVQYETIMLIGGNKRLKGRQFPPTPTSTFYPCPFVFTCWPKEKVQEAGVNRKRLLVTQLGMKKSRKLNTEAGISFLKVKWSRPETWEEKQTGLCISSLKISI